MYIGNVVPEYSRNPLTKEEVKIYLSGGFGPMVYRPEIEALDYRDLVNLGFTDTEIRDIAPCLHPLIDCFQEPQKSSPLRETFTQQKATNNNAGILLAAGLAAITLLG